ncbi:MAG TPA: hypothetical protein VM936_04805, partial [Pyrinomonadaceae bacterium]|nr:hypothetical protein [Pyrinomonadaceae bacterium]
MERNTNNAPATPSHVGPARRYATLVLVLILLYQPPLAMAGRLLGDSNGRGASPTSFAPAGVFVGAQAALASAARGALDYASGLFSSGYRNASADAPPAAADAAPVDPAAAPQVAPPITAAAVSLHHPTLNGGRIEGSMRVFSGESFTLNSPFQMTGDLYAVGSPNIVVNGNATHGGVVDDGGSLAPANYSVTLGSGVALPGKIHKRADALQLPNFPSTVPPPSGTRDVRVNSAADAAAVGDWKTVRDLTVSSGAVVDAPPGNYGTFTVNGSSRINLSAGTYNFTGPLDLNGNSSVVQITGRTTLNVGQGVKVGDTFSVNAGTISAGANTLPGDIIINVIGTSFAINGTGQVTGLVYAPNAAVNF